jgi:hypothetical protein
MNADSGFMSVHCVEVLIVTYVSGEDAASVFRVEVNRIGQCLCVYRYFI